MPLAIELAAARVRALSLLEILDSLHDRFRLLTGGARTAVRRQQTLRASVDWSHALLTETERMLFRRLAVFFGGFDLDCRPAGRRRRCVERYQVLDQLTLLVDKSLFVADDMQRAERATGCWRRCVSMQPRSSCESGEADTVRARHRDYYTALAALLDAPADVEYEQRLLASRDRDRQSASRVRLESRKLRRRAGIGARVFAAAIVGDAGPSPGRAGLVRCRPRRPNCPGSRRGGRGVCARPRGQGSPRCMGRHQQQLARGRTSPGDRARGLRAGPVGPALAACGFVAAESYNAEVAGHASPRRSAWPVQLDDRWRLSQLLALSGPGEHLAGDARATHAAAEEGRYLADAIGDGSTRVCVAFFSGRRSWCGAIWPAPPHSCARWRPKPRRLTTRS